jgi:hypothetical protein
VKLKVAILRRLVDSSFETTPPAVDSFFDFVAVDCRRFFRKHLTQVSKILSTSAEDVLR